MDNGQGKRDNRMTVTIDEHSGCCHGVRRAIEQAEKFLSEDGVLYCLGAIVHNGAEMARLSDMGMRTVDIGGFSALRDADVLIRAHGEPPSTYSTAAEHNLRLIDCTCPVVLRIQKQIAATYRELAPAGGQILIYGKAGHAEVNGLVGQSDGTAVVVQGVGDLLSKLSDCTVRTDVPTAIFSQTTMDPSVYSELCGILRGRCGSLTVHDTICRQVSSRLPHLEKFASMHDVIVFVCGRESSNGRNLFNLCRSVNPRSYSVEFSSEIRAGWFSASDTVGICGATSTPRRQLDECREHILGFRL